WVRPPRQEPPSSITPPLVRRKCDGRPPTQSAFHSIWMRLPEPGTSSMSALELCSRSSSGAGRDVVARSLKVCSARWAVRMPAPPTRASAKTPGRRYAADRRGGGGHSIEGTGRRYAADRRGGGVMLMRSRYGRILSLPSVPSASPRRSQERSWADRRPVLFTAWTQECVRVVSEGAG